MSPTPKQARQHRRKARPSDRTHNVNSFRVEGSWNDRPDRPAATKTPDKRKAYRIARTWAADGAYVIVQEHAGWDTWKTLDEFDGPALVAEHRRAQRAAVEEARQRAEEAERRLADAEERDRETAALERLMMCPPVPRDATGRVTARHTAGARP
ncbi:hypothetical protein ACFY0P_36840 [Streptomyces sp. NPDC001714]|uniref:hypothetical protein n=1 Tax=Streptomyces sp. NPDC001714 TaxID=3364603 RepID=UPI0036805550